MKNLILIVMAMVIALGIAGLGFPAEKATHAMNSDPTICNIQNCCQTNARKSASIFEKKPQESPGWSLSYQEALQRNGIEVPNDK